MRTILLLARRRPTGCGILKSLLTLLALLAVAPPTFAAVRYVDLNNPTPAAPYTDWATAATIIQDALDAAEAGDEIVVTNGVYDAGFIYANGMSRVALLSALTVRSVNGPAVTHIVGYQEPETTNGESAVRCAFLEKRSNSGRIVLR